MGDIRFECEEDFGTEEHRCRRDDGWLGGPYTEAPYFLSCLTRVNYVSTPFETWDPELRAFFADRAPQGCRWIVHSNYFHPFAILILKHLYRECNLSKRFPIRTEHRTERAARYAICHPQLTLEKLAALLKTTVKQLERNSEAMLARREFERLDSSPLNPEP
jgi:hypothetical protein